MAQKQQAPIIELAKEYNIGTIAAGKTHKFILPIKNTGANPLEIRRAYCSDDHLVFKTPKAIKSGKKGAVSIDINTKGLEPGAYSRQVLIISNDYEHSQQKVTVNWTVE